jgi:hypothetical protein
MGSYAPWRVAIQDVSRKGARDAKGRMFHAKALRTRRDEEAWRALRHRGFCRR